MKNPELTQSPEVESQRTDVAPLVEYILNNLGSVEAAEDDGSGNILRFTMYSDDAINRFVGAEELGYGDIVDSMTILVDLNLDVTEDDMSLVVGHMSEYYQPQGDPSGELAETSEKYRINLHTDERHIVEQENWPRVLFKTEADAENFLHVLQQNLPINTQETEIESKDYYYMIIEKNFSHFLSQEEYRREKQEESLNIQERVIDQPYEKTEPINPEVIDLDRDDIKEVVSKVALDQADYLIEDKARGYLLEELRDYLTSGNDKYMPKKRVELANNLSVNMTDVMIDSWSQRHFVLAYIEGEANEMAVRTFYRSISHNTWRLLPDRHVDIGGIYCKGEGSEIGVTLPIALQKILGESSWNAITDSVTGVYEDVITREEHVTQGHDCPDSPKDKPFIAKELRNNLYFNELLEEDSPRDPDFNTPEAQWTEHDPRLYGIVMNQVFRSYDGSLLYLYKKDQNVSSWLGTVEPADSPVKINGLLKKTLSMDKLITPPYEYGINFNGKDEDVANSEDFGDYKVLSPEYLSRIRLVRMYADLDVK